jgi:type IX secretion system PorP/SprF family membrane protein
MRKYLLLFVACTGSYLSFGQQDPLYSQYLFNPFILNPAYAGYSKDLSALVSYRSQWSGYDGAPVTANASGHIALVENRMGLGLNLIQDQIGVDENRQVQISYAYHLLLDNNRKISFGLLGGVAIYQTDYSELTIDESDPKFQGRLNETKPVIGTGIIYSSNNLYAGLSVPNLMKTSTNSAGVEVTRYNQHAYAHLTYVFTLSHRMKLKPFVLARAVQGSPLNMDVGAVLSADDSYTLGLFSRSLNTYGFLAKFHLGDIMRIGYVFELPTNASVGSQYVTHEFTLGIRMKLMKFHDLSTISDF